MAKVSDWVDDEDEYEAQTWCKEWQIEKIKVIRK